MSQGNSLTPEQQARIIKLYGDKVSVVDIAKRLDIRPITVARCLERAGVKGKQRQVHKPSPADHVQPEIIARQQPAEPRRFSWERMNESGNA